MCSDTYAEATQNAAQLQEPILEQQVDDDSDLSARLEKLRLSTNDNEGDTLAVDSTITSGAALTTQPTSQVKKSVLDADLSTEEPFEATLAVTTVYGRSQPQETDVTSMISTNRSRAWSVLSGLSLSQLSANDLAKLPLNDTEIRSRLSLVSPPVSSLVVDDEKPVPSLSGHILDDD